MATMVSATVAFGGVAIVAPSADADIRITSQYSPLDQADLDAAKAYNKQFRADHATFGNFNTAYGAGWCIDENLPVPQVDTLFDVRKLDGTSGYYGFNGDLGGDLRIHPDIQKAAINLTKLMLTEYKRGNGDQVKKMNMALQALLSNDEGTVDKMRGLIEGSVTAIPRDRYAQLPPKVTAQEFLQWTGFDVAQNPEKPLGQTRFYLVKNDQVFNQLNVKSGEYVTVLVPRDYNLHADQDIEPTHQRIVIVAQPGLEGYEPNVKRPEVRETTWVPQPPVTVTETKPGQVVTVTERVQPAAETWVEERPKLTVTEYYQPKTQVTETVTQPDTTVTETRRPEMSGVTETYTREVQPTTVTSTLPAQTVTVRKEEPVIKTVTETVTPQSTVDGQTQTAVVTKTAEPSYETVTKTLEPVTETATVTAAPKTEVSYVTETIKNVTNIERTTEVERYYRHYSYAFDFGFKEGASQTIPVEGLGDWKIDFVDDSNGLVKVEKVIVDGKAQLKITPQREGRGLVRVIVVDGEGNRHEYAINVVNERSEKIVENNVTVNNHYFNVGVGAKDQTIQIPQNWDYKITEGGQNITTGLVDGGLKVTFNEGASGTSKIEVFEKGKSENNRNQNNYIFNIDGSRNRFEQTRIIGNANSYKLEVKDVEKQPKIVSGAEFIESISRDSEGFWIITPRKDAQGDAVIEATDKNGDVYTYTLKIKQGTNVLVDVQTIKINEGDSATIKAEDGLKLEQISGDKNNWEIQTVDGGYKIVNKVNGSATFNLYAEDQNAQGGRILVGVYTVIAQPIQDEKFEPVKTERNILDRNTVELTPGDANNEIKVTKGKDNATVVFQDGKYRIMPKPGFEGDIEVTETAQGKPIAIYTLHVAKGVVERSENDVKAGFPANISNIKPGGSEIRVVEGENLLDLNKTDLTRKHVEFKPGVTGKVVIENLNSRGIPFQEFTFNVTPVQAQEQTIELTGDSRAEVSLPKDYTYELKGADVVDVTRQGDTLVLKPMSGQQGTATLEVKDENGTVVYRYTLEVDGTKRGATGSTINNSFDLTQSGTFKITRVNKNPLSVESGSQWVNIEESNGEWILTPKGPDSVGKTVTVVETRDDVIVKRYEITIQPDPTPLGYKEERRVILEQVDGQVVAGKKGNTLHVRRGNDIVKVVEPAPGELQIVPQEGKSGYVVVEELDAQGSLVRVIEMEVPDTAQGNTVEPPKLTEKGKGDRDKGWTIKVEGGSNSVIVNTCNDSGCTVRTVLDPKWVKPTEDGIQVLPGAPIPAGTDHLEIIGLPSSIRQGEAKLEINVNTKNESGVHGDSGADQGSSDLDGKCIAGIVGLTAPLLLAIPVGILSQVQIPGLEGLSAQINDAIRQANDQIQKGLGIYDEDRAQRAASLQGGFSVDNPQMLQLAAGSLGAITLGLFLIDQVLRACGQEEMTSSYQIGKATNSDTLMYGSSGKASAKTKTPAKPSDANKEDDKK